MVASIQARFLPWLSGDFVDIGSSFLPDSLLTLFYLRGFFEFLELVRDCDGQYNEQVHLRLHRESPRKIHIASLFSEQDFLFVSS